MAIFDTFDGAADQLISSRPGWVKHRAASPELVSTNGSGAAKMAVYTTGYPALVVHNTGNSDHYAECVIGSGATGLMNTSLRLLTCRQPLEAVQVGINVIYSSNYDTLYIRNNDTTLAESSAAGVKLVAGDVLRLEVLGTTARVYRNGVQVLTATIPSSTNTYAGFGGNANSALDPLITEFSAGTLVPADIIAPNFSGTISVVSKTSSTMNLTLPTATDAVGVTGYRYRINSGVWVDNGNSTSVNITGLMPLTSYTIDAQAYDAVPNYSSSLSITTSTYRVGASAGSIVTTTSAQDGNPEGALYALSQTLPTTDWVSYYTVSGPTPSGGTLDAQPNGAFSYTGPVPANWVIQPEVNGQATAEQITILLYDQPGVTNNAPSYTGTITTVSVGVNTAEFTLPLATDDVTVVGYQYRLNSGTWYSTTRNLILTGLAENTAYTLETRAYDAETAYSSSVSTTFNTLTASVPPGGSVVSLKTTAGYVQAEVYVKTTAGYVSPSVNVKTGAGYQPLS